MTMWAAGATVVAAGIGYMGSKKQADAAQAAGKDPFGRKNRQLYQRRLNELTKDPEAIFSNPAFVAAQERGLDAVERKMAAQGFLGSGNEATALMDYSMGSALDWLTNQERFLAELAGAGNFGSPGAVAAGSQMNINGMMSALGQLGGAAQMAFGGTGGGGGGGGGVIGGGGYGSNTMGGGNWGSFYPIPQFSSPPSGT